MLTGKVFSEMNYGNRNEGGAKAELDEMERFHWSAEKKGKERLGGGANESEGKTSGTRKRIASVKRRLTVNERVSFLLD